MISADYQIATLANGLRVVTHRLEGEVSYIGLVTGAGSRNEPAELEGLAHFVEHTVFKGTRHRSSWAISNRMEQVGGELNAYTSKEETMIYTNAPAGYESRALDLLADLVKNASFPKAEIEREREVIIEEINSYRDSPSDSVYDEFEELAYSGCPLAHNILGTPESVRSLTGEDARGFIDRWYTPRNMVVYACGPGDPNKYLKLTEKYFGDLNFAETPRIRETIPALTPFDETRDRDNHQANTVIGTRVFNREDPRRFALFLLNNYLGGPCMNSRLNLEMREKRGLVYTVESNVSLLSDTGLFTVYFGTDPSSVKKCEKIIRREIDRLAQNRLSDAAFNRISRQYCGQLLVSSDHRESRAMALAKSVLYFNQIVDIRATTERIRSVTAEDFREMAQLIAGNGLSRLTLT